MCSIHDITGEFLVHIPFGQAIKPRIELILSKPPVKIELPFSGIVYVDELGCKLYEIYELDRDKLLEASDRLKKAYDLRKNFKSQCQTETKPKGNLV